VAACEQDPRELDPASLAAREHAHREVEPIRGEAEAGADPPRLRLRGVPAGVPVVLLGAREARHVAAGRVLLDRETKLLQALARAAEPPPRQYVADRGQARVDPGDA